MYDHQCEQAFQEEVMGMLEEHMKTRRKASDEYDKQRRPRMLFTLFSLLTAVGFLITFLIWVYLSFACMLKYLRS